MQNAHLAIGSAVVLIAAVALTMLQVRSTSVVREAEATVNLADDVVLMKDGRVVQRGPIQALLEAPAEAFVTEFVNAQRVGWGSA